MADNTVKIRASLENKVSGPLNDIRKAMDKSLGKGSSASFFGNVGAKAVTKGFDLIGDAAGAAMGFIGDAQDAASNLNEETSKSGVIFGENADDIQAWAKTGAEAFGQSERAALEAASGFAGMFATVGEGIDEATTRSKQLVQLGGDLASFFNTDMQTALDALKSGLSGESEPLRRFNVFLSETAVTAKLTQMGVEKVGGAFTESQKATARYRLILEQTSSAQGDFARTADGLANSQRTADAELENMQATLGEKFLPIAKQVTEWQIDFIKGLGVLGDALGAAGIGVEHTTAQLQDFADRGSQAAQSRLRAMALEADSAAESMTTDLESMRGAIWGMGSSMSQAAVKVESSLVDMESALTNALPAIEGAARDLADAIYDPQIARAELAETEQEIIRQRNLRNAAAAGSKERTEAQNNIDQLNKKKIVLLGELASYGDAAATEALQTQINVLKSIATLSSGQRYQLALLEAALQRVRDAALRMNAQLRDDVRNTGRGRQHGGPVMSGGVYTVGEAGPETLVMGSGSGYVLPSALRGGARPQPIVIITKTYLDKRQIAEAVDEENHWRAGEAGSLLGG